MCAQCPAKDWHSVQSVFANSSPVLHPVWSDPGFLDELQIHCDPDQDCIVTVCVVISVKALEKSNRIGIQDTNPKTERLERLSVC